MTKGREGRVYGGRRGKEREREGEKREGKKKRVRELMYDHF